jgi:hypothetical protein
VISKYKTAKHFAIAITDTSLAVQRRQGQIDAEAALDGFYVLRTPVPASQLDAPGVVTADKNLKYVERDSRHLKADDLCLPGTGCRRHWTRLSAGFWPSVPTTGRPAPMRSWRLLSQP